MARILFLPFGIVAGLIAGAAATRLFERVWKLVDDEEEPPGPGDPEADVAKVVLASVLRASVFSATRVLFDRGARRFFQHTVGVYPAKKQSQSEAA